MQISNINKVDVTKLKANKADSKVISLENLVKLTVRNLAIANDQSDSEFLNGHSILELVKNIESYARSQEDINSIINLTIGHAADIIKKYSAEGKTILFAELVELTNKYPDNDITSLVSYILAKKDPQLAGVAYKLLGSERKLDNPHIVYNPLYRQIVYVDKDELQPNDIYERTNAEDKEVMEYREKKQQETITDIKKLNYLRLAKLEMEVKSDPEKADELQRAKFQTNFIVRT